MQRIYKSKTVFNVVRFGNDRQDVVGCAIWLRTCLASLRASYRALSSMQWLRQMADCLMATTAAAARPHTKLAMASLRGERGQRSPRWAAAPDIG